LLEYSRFITLETLKLAQAFGFLYPRELFTLQVAAWSLEIEKPVYVNIGAGAGTSSLGVREARPDMRMFTVDISPSGPYGGLENERNAFAPYPEWTLPTQILGDSKTCEWTFGPIDFLFIDGDHSYAGCKGDMDHWIPFVKSGGIVAWHDYEGVHWPEVKRAVDELVDWPVIARVDSLMVKRKP
jgi:hypothetical protein